MTYEDQLATWISTPELYNMKVISLSNFLSLKRENPGSQTDFLALFSARMSFANKPKCLKLHLSS